MENFCAILSPMSRKEFTDKLLQIVMTALLAACIAFFQSLIATFSTLQVPLQSPAEVAVLGGSLRWLQLWSLGNLT